MKIKRTSEWDNSDVLFDYETIIINISIGEETEWLNDDQGYGKLAYQYEIELRDKCDIEPDDRDIYMAIGMLEQIKKILLDKLNEQKKKRD